MLNIVVIFRRQLLHPNFALIIWGESTITIPVSEKEISMLCFIIGSVITTLCCISCRIRNPFVRIQDSIIGQIPIIFQCNCKFQATIHEKI